MASQLLDEIYEQPSVIRRLLDTEAANVAQIAESLCSQDIRYMVIAARGTSDNAARYAQYVFGAQNHLTVALAAPSLFSIYHRPPRLDSALVIGISQSGQSPDIVSVVEEARRCGSPTVAVTNEPRSPLAQAAQHLIELHAGEEKSVAATKTYTAQLTALALLSVCLTRHYTAQEHGQPDELQAVPAAMEKALHSEPQARAAAALIAGSDRCVTLGRGFNYATAFELALKIKELAYVVAEPYSAADFMHGPIAMVEPSFPAVLINVGETMRSEMQALRASLREQGACLAVLGDDESATDDAWIPVPGGLPEWLTPIIAIVPGQLLAYHLTIARGGDPDRPRTIRKVTLTH